MEREHADKLSFPTMSLASDGTISNIWETCKTCGKVFENEQDLKNHMERVHVYGELFQLLMYYYVTALEVILGLFTALYLEFIESMHTLL